MSGANVNVKRLKKDKKGLKKAKTAEKEAFDSLFPPFLSLLGSLVIRRLHEPCKPAIAR